MAFGKIVIKNKYEEEGDLVFRPLIRAFKKIGADCFISGNEAFILGTIDKEDHFREFLTGKEIDYNGCVELGYGDIISFSMALRDKGLSKEQIENMRDIINKLVFKEPITLAGNLAEDIKDDANDRVVELVGYENGLSSISPYDRENPNGYKDFMYKCEVLNHKKMKSK